MMGGSLLTLHQSEPPLVLYAFTNKRSLAQKSKFLCNKVSDNGTLSQKSITVLDNTQSGGVCINDCLMHQAGKKQTKRE